MTTFSGYTINVTQDIDLWRITDAHKQSTITSNSFQGTFDGNGHKISGLSIGTAESPSTLVYNGFFGYAKTPPLKTSAWRTWLYTRPLQIDGSRSCWWPGRYLEEASALENCYVTGYLESKKLSDRGAFTQAESLGFYGELMVSVCDCKIAILPVSLEQTAK